MQSITEKTYQKLVLKVSLKGFSFALINTLSSQITSFGDINFDAYENPFDTEQCYKKAFSEQSELKDRFDEVVVLHANNLSVFVPQALFDENHLGDYLNYNVKVFESDFFAFDQVDKYQFNCVYVPYVNINNILLDYFSDFDYKHASSVLVERLLDLSKNDDDKQMFVHFEDKSFQMIVVQNRKLLFYNSFEFTTQEDFAYYLLFTIEQLGMNPEFLTLKMLGHISDEGELFKIAYTYIRNVSLLDTSYLSHINGLESKDNLTHYILVQS